MRYLPRKSILLVPVLLSLAACGGVKQPDPVRDDPFERTMDVADEAVFYDRLQQAELSYKKSFEYALTSDDAANIDDAGYNLAIIQLGLNNTQTAMATVEQTNRELQIREQQNSPQLDLVKAAILYRMEQYEDAGRAAQNAANSEHHDIQERAYFMSALIAYDQGNINSTIQFAQELDKLIASGKSEDAWKADQFELHALIAYKQGQYDQALADARNAQNIRRQDVEYRAMVRTLALQAQINQTKGNNLAAAQLYVRAGKSAMFLKDYKDAKKYLGNALSLDADTVTYQLASDALSDLNKRASKPSE